MWTLGYDGGLYLRFPAETTATFLSGSFYKLYLKRYVHEAFDGFIRFKGALTYLDYKRIIVICKKEAEKHIWELLIDKSLSEYIESRELHIEVRSRLGIELKAHDEKLAERFEDYKAIVDSAMTRKLRERQMWDSFFMCAMQKSANFSVPGSGKTASVLGMYAFLHQKEIVKRIVVVCPKNAFGSWIDEFNACFNGIQDLCLMNIHDPQYKNLMQRKSALQLDSGKCNLILVNYESVGTVIEPLLSIISHDTLLVFDEVHKVKRVGGEYAEHALSLAKNASHLVAMTGTPIPNSYTDIYNLLHILFSDEYDEFFDFSVPMLRKPSADDILEINNKLLPFFCRTTKKQLGVPKANEDCILKNYASDTENQILNILKLKYKRNKLALLVRILQLESNPKMLLQSLDLRDFKYLLEDHEDIDEIDFADYSKEIQDLINGCNTATKFDQCIELISDLIEQGKPVIVWCMFVDSINRINIALQDKGIRAKTIFGEVALEDRQQLISDFRNGEYEVLITNPHTLAESVSLHSICHDAIYFEYSYNLVHLLQSKDRIHRLGLPENQYTQYYYLQLSYKIEQEEWSMQGAVYERLKEKEKIMLDAIDNHRLESMPTDEEDLDMIFSKLF